MEISSILVWVPRIDIKKKKPRRTHLFTDKLCIQYLTSMYICTHGEGAGQMLHPVASTAIPFQPVDRGVSPSELWRCWNRLVQYWIHLRASLNGLCFLWPCVAMEMNTTWMALKCWLQHSIGISHTQVTYISRRRAALAQLWTRSTGVCAGQQWVTDLSS